MGTDGHENNVLHTTERNFPSSFQLERKREDFSHPIMTVALLVPD
jgi:hypothetical protein